MNLGVCLSHASLLERMTYFLPYGQNDVNLCYSSLYWLSGLAALLFSTICQCQRIITTIPFSPESFCEKVTKYKVLIDIYIYFFFQASITTIILIRYDNNNIH